MYMVADNMKRLEFIAEMPLFAYTDEDIEYLNHLFDDNRELLSEGAALTLYTSCKYIIAQIASSYQEQCYNEPFVTDIPKEVRLTFYSLTRKKLPEILKAYKPKYGDLELYVSKHICVLYEKIINYHLGIDFTKPR